jgi:N-acetylneuraminate synthase
MKRCKIIAEAGVNHNGSIEIAKKLIDAAVVAGADVVKFQTFRADSLVTKSAKMANYQVLNTGNNSSQYQMLKALELSREDHHKLFDYCNSKGIEFLSTGFDSVDLNFLVGEKLIRQIKIPSGELINGPFLLEASKLNLPILLSTGMSSLEEIERALGVIAFGYLNPYLDPRGVDFGRFWQNEGAMKELKAKVTILQCTTEYPAPFSEVNLLAMQTFSRHFQLDVGFSDHTAGIEASVAAVALGASIIEKHFTLDRKMDGPDHVASLEPEELVTLVKSIRNVEEAMGNGIKVLTDSEKKNVSVARKSLVATKKILAGESFTSENLGVKRPGHGKSPYLYWDYLGKKAEKDYDPDDLI